MKSIFIVFLHLLIICNNADAFRTEHGNNIIISQPVFEDLYIAGGTVTINAPVHGDLICAGGTININDSVYNDILIAGGNITFNGYVGDDIRCAGGQLNIQRSVSGDVVITGGKVTADKAVIIGGGLLISGGDITFNATVKNSMRLAAGNLIFNGVAEKDVDLRGGKLDLNGQIAGPAILAAPDILIGANAMFNNDVRYWNTNGKLDFKSSLKNGHALYDKSLEIATGKWYYLGGITVLGLLWYVGSAFMMIAIIQYLFSATMQLAGKSFYTATLKSFGSGLAFVIAVPVLTVLTFITIIGIPLGLLVLFNYIIVILLASIIAAVVCANWFNNSFNYAWSYWKLVLVALGIFAVLKLTAAVPLLGWPVVFIFICTAFGAIIQNIPWKKRHTATDNV